MSRSEECADRAEGALRGYHQACGSIGEFLVCEEAISDLIADLHFLCDRAGLDPVEVAERGRRHYEREEEEIGAMKTFKVYANGISQFSVVVRAASEQDAMTIARDTDDSEWKLEWAEMGGLAAGLTSAEEV